MTQAKKIALLLGGLGIPVAIVLSIVLNNPEAQRNRRHRESMAKWNAENPAATTDRYLDSRTGAALERTVKGVISNAGYQCDSVRAIARIEADVIARLRAEDGRWVDCNDDGVYGVIESADGFRAVKR